MSTNGIEQAPRKITVFFDDEKGVVRHIDATGFSTQLAIAVLGMAQDELKFILNLHRAQAAQQQAVQQAVAERVAHQEKAKLDRNLHLG